MSEKDKPHFGDTSLGVGISIAVIILAIMLGFGGCLHLIDSSPAEVERVKQRD